MKGVYDTNRDKSLLNILYKGGDIVAFKAIIHSPASQERMQEIHKAVSQYRAEKIIKYLTAMGVTTDTLQDILLHMPVKVD